MINIGSLMIMISVQWVGILVSSTKMSDMLEDMIQTTREGHLPDLQACYLSSSPPSHNLICHPSFRYLLITVFTAELRFPPNCRSHCTTCIDWNCPQASLKGIQPCFSRRCNWIQDPQVTSTNATQTEGPRLHSIPTKS